MSPTEIRSRRLHIGWSREQLAYAIGVSVATLRAWEDGTLPVSCPRAIEQVLRQREGDDRRDQWLGLSA